MKKLIEFSARHPVSVLMYFSLAIILGGISLFCINTSLLPQTKDRWLFATARYDGVRAEEIKKLVALPLEESLSCLKDAKRIESVSRDGICALRVELKWGADADAALLEANALLDAAMESLPDDCPRPQAQKSGGSAGTVKIFVVPKDKNLAAATEFARNELKAKVLAFKETAAAEISGGQKSEIQIVVDSKKAAFYGLSLDAIAQALNLSNYDYPAGTVQDGDDDILLKTEGTFKNFFEILDTTLKTSLGPLKLGGLASAKKALSKSESFKIFDSDRCVELAVQCKKNENPLALGKKIKRLENEVNSKNANFALFVSDESGQEILATMKNLFFSALAGAAAAFFLLLVFFHSAKIALLIAAEIPLSALFTFFVLLCLGKSANIISIAGVTLCLGMTIDNSIVAMESVLARKRDCDCDCECECQDACGCAEESAAEAVKKIALANTASTTTTIIVFVPVFFIGGVFGELFCDLGIAVLSGMIFSLLFSFTVIPAACPLFLREELQKARLMDLSFLESRWKKILERTNKIKRLCPAAMAASTLLALLILLPIKKEIQPKGAQKSFFVLLSFEPGSSQRLLERQGEALAARIRALDGVKKVLAAGGLQKDKAEDLADAEKFSEQIIFTVYGSRLGKTKAECENIFRSQGLAPEFLEPEDLISQRLFAKDRTLLFGENQESRKKARKVFKANKHLMEKLGVSPLSLSAALKSSFDGTEAFPYYENGREIGLRVQFEENEFSSQKNLAALRLPAKNGMAALSSLGRWEDERSPCLYYRHCGKDAVAIPKSAAPKKGFSVKKLEMAELLKSGGFLLLLVMALLYFVLGAQTESFKTPLIYMTALPPAFLGAALFLACFRSSLNLNSIMGFAALFGTSVNSAIILHEGGNEKFSSVLATTATSAAALLPFAFDPLGLNPQSSLALALLGGLLLSSAASLILIPNIKNNGGRQNESL